MKVNLGIWDKLTPVVIFLLFIAIIMLVGMWYLPRISRTSGCAKILRLETLIRKEEETLRQLRSSADALLHDTKAVELWRERLGYARPEIIIRFEEPLNGVFGAKRRERAAGGVPAVRRGRGLRRPGRRERSGVAPFSSPAQS